VLRPLGQRVGIVGVQREVVEQLLQRAGDLDCAPARRNGGYRCHGSPKKCQESVLFPAASTDQDAAKSLLPERVVQTTQNRLHSPGVAEKLRCIDLTGVGPVSRLA
jgi:hypothetical protein